MPRKRVLVLIGTQESHSVTRFRSKQNANQACSGTTAAGVQVGGMAFCPPSPPPVAGIQPRQREAGPLPLPGTSLHSLCERGEGADVHLGWWPLHTTLPMGSLFQIHRIPGAQPETLWLPISKLHTHRSCF